MMTSEHRVSMTSCDSVSSGAMALPMIAVHAGRRSRSVDSGLVTDVDLSQRPLTTLPVSDVQQSAALSTGVLGSCDSGLPQHVEQECTPVHERLSDCDCNTLVSSPSTRMTKNHAYDVDVMVCHSPDVFVTPTSNRQNGRQGSVCELTDRRSDSECSTVVSSSSTLTTQRSCPDNDVTTCQSSAVSVTSNRQSWLLRLFESKLFDMSIAIQYLFNSKESGVQTYIGELFGYTHLCHKSCFVFMHLKIQYLHFGHYFAHTDYDVVLCVNCNSSRVLDKLLLLAVVAGNRMFSFNEVDVDFFLPQLLTLYINMHDVAEATHPYIVYRSCVFLVV